MWARVSPWPGGGGLNCTAWLRNACQLTKATGPNGENELGLPLQKLALFFEHDKNIDPHTQQLPYFMQEFVTFLLAWAVCLAGLWLERLRGGRIFCQQASTRSST